MIKEALQYIVAQARPEIREINGQTWSDKNLVRIDYHPKNNNPISFSTLDSLVDYIVSDFDFLNDMYFVHVESPTRVKVFSNLDNDMKRDHVAEVRAEIPDQITDRYMDCDKFLLALRSRFVETEDQKLLLKYAGTVEAGTITEYGDDGVSQKAVVKTGVASKSDALLPSSVLLAPYRTFSEVSQVESSFVFRMEENKGHITCGIFECDGGAWRLKAMAAVKNYLQERLADRPNFKVIS